MTLSIIIWLNKGRMEKIRKVGLEHLTKNIFADMYAIAVPVNDVQKEVIVKEFPQVKITTTDTIELFPRDAKNMLFELIIEKRSVDVIDEFIRRIHENKETINC